MSHFRDNLKWNKTEEESQGLIEFKDQDKLHKILLENSAFAGLSSSAEILAAQRTKNQPKRHFYLFR
jgi:hypothetical protein